MTYYVRTRHLSSGWKRWRADCTCGWQSAAGGEPEVNAWRDEHAFPDGGQPHAWIEATRVPL